MTDPVSFTSASPRHALPFLFVGQAQKEFFVNQAHALADMLLHPAILGEASSPPASPVVGECWLVGASPTGDWAGRQGHLACRQANAWLFAPAREGMTVLDQSNGQVRRYVDGAWAAATTVAAPTDGAVVDTEARTAINGLIAALIAAGIFPQPA